MPSLKIALVMGAHRSGTSLLASALETLGAYLGSNLRGASDENPKGFFENNAIVSFDDRLLTFLGGSWDNPLFDGRQAIGKKHAAEMAPWLNEAEEIFLSHFKGQPLVAIKDPRICQVLPFWQQVIGSCGYRPCDIYYVHITRHPMEIAQSQYKRRKADPRFYMLGDNLLETVSLWFSMSYQALRDINSDNNYFVLYTDLLRHPEQQLRRLAEFLGVPCCSEKIDEFCASFVEKKLRRNIAGSQKTIVLKKQFPEAMDLFCAQQTLALKRTFTRADTTDALKIWNRKNSVKNLVAPLSPFLSRLSVQRISLNARLDIVQTDFEKQIDDLRRDREQVRADLERDREQVRAALEAELDRIRMESDALRADFEKQIDQLKTEKNQMENDSLEKAAQLNRLRSAYENELEGLRQTTALMQKEHSSELNALKNSLSWRITSPLRWMRKLEHIVVKSLRAQWMRLRAHSRKTGLKMNSRAPAAHMAAATVVRPFLRLGDNLLAKSQHQPFEDKEVAGVFNFAGFFRSRYQHPDLSINKQLLVSIIVPNYNHDRFLKQRLDSIYSQTYENYEVILLDDSSSDTSRRILDEYATRHSDKTKTIYNDKNSGGVFFQWAKGFSAASGDLVWIAESDDWCDTRFLEELVKYFHDEAVMLAYCRTAFMDENGNRIWTIEEYLADLDPYLWQNSFVKTAHQIVNSAWSIKNIVPNVSSVLFRHPGKMKLLKEDAWKGMRICGDWVFYLHLIQGGLVAYSSSVTNYFRMHGGNTSVSTYSKDSYYTEHEQVAEWVNRLYSVPDHVFKLQKENIKQQWIQNRPDFSEEDFRRCYDLNRIRKAADYRKPNLLMASYAFAPGGGETLPIQLANLLKGGGYAVTFFNCEQEPREDEVRNMLRKDIPVVSNVSMLNGIVVDFGIEAIHSHHAWVDNTILDLLPEDSDCKTVISLHGMYETIPNRDVKNLLPRLVARTGKFVYTADKNLESFLRNDFYREEKFIKIANALEAAPITPVARESLGIAPDAFVLCLVSRALPEKGWREAIESVIMARKTSGRKIHLLLIGEGDEYDHFTKSGHPEYVHLLGFRNNIRDYYAAADMGFLPSRFRGESFPLVVIDCLLAGNPVLASNAGEIPSMLAVNDKVAGCIFPLDNWKIPVRQMADLIVRCATDKNYYDRLKRLVPAAVKKFDPETMRDNYDAVYTSLTHAGKRAVMINPQQHQHDAAD